MFFKKKKPKIDPKIRFQNRQFNEKLHQARTFKRTVRAIPEGSFKKFLMHIGLGSTWKQVFVLIIAAGILYVVYIPNFLSTQKFVIEGMSASDATATENAIRDGIRKAPFYNPQRNLLFLSKTRISEAAHTVAGVDHINSIKKDFKTKTVYISITSKYERFLVRDTDRIYDVYNDGSTKGTAGLAREAWVDLRNPAMIKIDVGGKITNENNTEFLTPDTVKYILEAEQQARGIVGSTLAHVQITLPEFNKPAPPVEETPSEQDEAVVNLDAEPATEQSTAPPDPIASPEPMPEPVEIIEITLPLKADELELIFQKGSDAKKTFRVLIDTKENPGDLIQRLNLLLSQTAPDRYNALSYIDLRVKNRAFVCLLGAPCN